ncbi:MAG: hypothetical protein IT330_12690 [Anaerolineae bacterium]|nr:hypothetical protein [Anaerolineae bacterium]
MFPPQKVTVTCPQCRTPYVAEVRSVVDVKQEPALKLEMMRGRLNESTCPTCKRQNPMLAPLLYHDPAHDFLAAFLPPELNLSEMQRQRIIGDLTNRLLTQTPQQDRRGYFLQPRQFLTMESLRDAILMADGVTREELDKQRTRTALLERVLATARDEESLRTVVRDHDSEFDADFFHMLTAMAEDAADDNNQRAGEALLGLREILLDFSSYGKKLRAQHEAITSLTDSTTREELLEKIVAARDDGVVDALVMAARPLVDYVFFQQLTSKADAARRDDKAEAARLERLRDHIVDLTAALDKATREALDRATTTLRAILGHPDVRDGVRHHAAEINDAFLSVLTMNIQAAQQRGNREAFQILRRVWDEIQELLEESAPPEVRLLNQLIRADYPEGTRSLLEANRAQLNDTFLQTMDTVAAQMEEEQNAEGAKRIRAIRAQAVLMG